MEQEVQQIQNEQAYNQEHQELLPTEMQENQEVYLNQEESENYTMDPEDCGSAHRMVLETPEGSQTVSGICKHCGIEKNYEVYPYDRYYAERRSGRGPALNL